MLTVIRNFADKAFNQSALYQNKMSRLISLSIFLLISSIIPQTIVAFNREETIKSLKNDLVEDKNATDSIITLFDIFDLSIGEQRNSTGELIYQTAIRIGDDHAALDVLRVMTSMNPDNDSIQDLMLKRVQELPSSEKQRQTALYIAIKIATKRIPEMSDEERRAHLESLVKKHNPDNLNDPYARIEYLFNLCSYLYSAEEGSLLEQHLTELKDLIDSLPEKNSFLSNAFYTHATNAYITNGRFDKAIELNRKLLSVIENIERRYRSDGRRFKSFDTYKYTCYSRMLSAYKSLKPGEVDIYYNRVLSLAAQNPEVSKIFRQQPMPTICYMMAKKRYNEVIPIVKPLITIGMTNPANSYLIEAYKEAADSTNNIHEQFEALKLYTEMLKTRIRTKSVEHFRELQIRYDIDKLRNENQNLELEKRGAKIAQHRATIVYTSIALAGALTLLLIVYVLYRRSKRLAQDVIDTNATLKTERDNLKATQQELIEARDKAKNAERVKTDFINNMSHEIKTPLHAIVEYTHLITDCVDAEKKKYLTRFSDIITLNTELLLTIVNDVLDIASIENSKMNIRIRTESVKSICRFAIDSTNKYLSPGVRMIFENADDPDISIKTDAHRAEQVLLNLLVNAAKFTTQGTITVGYQLISDGKDLEFSVTDTGSGIPRGSEEIIFERFRQLSSQDQGCGLGLYISRLIARLLNGDVEVDTSYRKGARFLFRLPVYQ